jgi:hypothetical protein
MSPIGRRCARPSSDGPTPNLGRAARWLAFALAIAAAAAFAEAAENLGFESVDEPRGLPLGWSFLGPADAPAGVASDADTVMEGQRSLRIERLTAAGVTRVTQRFASGSLPQGGTRRVRLSGYARVAAAATATPSLWLRIDGAKGPLYLDSDGASGASPDAAAPDSTGAMETSGDWRRYEVELPLPADVEEIALGVAARGVGVVWFDGLELASLATDSAAAPSPAAVRYVEAALAIMREHALNRAAVDWPALRAAALEHARGASSASDAHLAVRFAIRELGDRHSYLQSPRVSLALRDAPVANARTGAPLTAAEGRPLDGGVAYLSVPAFAGGTPAHQLEFAESLKSIIQAHDAAAVCGWVVDLRQNSGGNLWPMVAGLGPLLGDGDLAASVYPDGRRVGIWYRDGRAGFGDYVQLRVPVPYRLHTEGPVAVLTGPATASSAEVLAVAFRGRPETRSFGAPTRGVSAGNRTFALPDGASLLLTVAATTDRDGRVFSGPVPPDEPIGRASAGTGGEDAVVAAALGWLAGRDSCR